MPYVALDFDKTEEAASRHSAHGHCIANDPVVLRCASSTSALRTVQLFAPPYGTVSGWFYGGLGGYFWGTGTAQDTL